MTAPDADPFAEDPIQRDGHKRPLIIPIKRGKPDLKVKLVPYTRASTFCGALDDVGGLLKWSLWHLALGLGRNPDLAALAGVFGPTVDDLSRGDKAALDDIIERAHDRSGGNVKADYGTVVHTYTEPGAQAVPDPFSGPAYDNPSEQAHRAIIASLQADVGAYLKIMDDYGLEVIDTEQFVVNDEVQAAGTYDHKVRLSRDLTFAFDLVIPAGTVVILDKKTGKLHLDSQSIQLAVYANAKTYDPLTGERGDLGVSYDHAILAHIPKSGGEAFLYLVDIRAGWAAAKLAEKVRAHRTRKDLAVPFPAVVTEAPADDTWGVTPDELAAEFPTPEDVTEFIEAVNEDIAAMVEVTAVAPIVDVTEFAPLDDWADTPPATIAEPETVEDAVANLAAAGLNPVEIVDPVLVEIGEAADGDACRALWTKHKATWSDQYTAAVKTRLAELAAA